MIKTTDNSYNENIGFFIPEIQDVVKLVYMGTFYKSIFS